MNQRTGAMPQIVCWYVSIGNISCRRNGRRVSVSIGFRVQSLSSDRIKWRCGLNVFAAGTLFGPLALFFMKVSLKR